MSSQIKYIVQGVLLVIFVLVAVSTITLLSSTNRISPDKSLSAIIKEPDSAYAITNLKGQYLFREKCSACHSLFKRADPDLLQGFEERIPEKKLLCPMLPSNRTNINRPTNRLHF